MTPDEGYIYIPNWKKFQHYRDRTSPPWIKSYRALLHNTSYLKLSLADRGLLHDLWLLIADCGNGQLTCNSRTLQGRLGVRRVSLEPLIQAGFVVILASKEEESCYQDASLEREGEEREKENREDPLTPASGGTFRIGSREEGTNPRARAMVEKREKAVAACRRLYNQAISDGDAPEVAREWLENEYRHDPSIVAEAIAA